LKRREGLVMATIVFPFSAIELLSALPSCWANTKGYLLVFENLW
jgi:hypothetical protein